MSVYLYELDKDSYYPTNVPTGHEFDLKFHDQDGTLRLTITPSGLMIIHKGYAWDGCSPKFRIGNLYLGTWDGTLDDIMGRDTSKPRCYYPSCVHDVGYQFMHHQDFPYRRDQLDVFFLDLMEFYDFKLRVPYYLAVRTFGGVYNYITTNSKEAANIGI